MLSIAYIYIYIYEGFNGKIMDVTKVKIKI